MKISLDFACINARALVLLDKPRVRTAMDSLKKRLIRNGLPTDELYEMGEKFKAEIRGIAEGIMERCRNHITRRKAFILVDISDFNGKIIMYYFIGNLENLSQTGILILNNPFRPKRLEVIV